MDLSTVRICFSRPESEVVAGFLNAKRIGAVVTDRQIAAQMSDSLVALRGIRIQVPEAAAEDALALLASVPNRPDLAESRSFQRNMLLNAIFTLLLICFAGGPYFPFWIRSQTLAENSVVMDVT